MHAVVMTEADRSAGDTLADLRERLARVAESHLPEGDARAVTDLARPAIRLDQTDSDTGSHLGGNPLLPPSAPTWPYWDQKPLSFLARIDLAELAGFETDVRLPDSGHLNFFYEADEQMAWGFEPSHRDGWRVVYAPASLAVEVSAPEGSIVFPKVGLRPAQTLTIPGWEEDAVTDLVPRYCSPQDVTAVDKLLGSEKRHQERRDAYFALQDEWSPTVAWDREPSHQIGGWPRLQQGPIWRECQVVSQGVPLGTAEEWADPRVEQKLAGIDDWRLLLQLDTDDRTDWMWGDVGTLYYATRQSLEPTSAVDEAWMVFQCG